MSSYVLKILSTIGLTPPRCLCGSSWGSPGISHCGLGAKSSRKALKAGESHTRSCVLLVKQLQKDVDKPSHLGHDATWRPPGGGYGTMVVLWFQP